MNLYPFDPFNPSVQHNTHTYDWSCYLVIRRLTYPMFIQPFLCNHLYIDPFSTSGNLSHFPSTYFFYLNQFSCTSNCVRVLFSRSAKYPSCIFLSSTLRFTNPPLYSTLLTYIALSTDLSLCLYLWLYFIMFSYKIIFI